MDKYTKHFLWESFLSLTICVILILEVLGKGVPKHWLLGMILLQGLSSQKILSLLADAYKELRELKRKHYDSTSNP